MKHNGTQFEEKNEPVDSIVGNYFIELEPGNYQAEEASDTSDAQPDLLQFSQADEINCKIVDLAVEVDVNSHTVVVIFGHFFFTVLKIQKGREPTVS